MLSHERKRSSGSTFFIEAKRFQYHNQRNATQREMGVCVSYVQRGRVPDDTKKSPFTPDGTVRASDFDAVAGRVSTI